MKILFLAAPIPENSPLEQPGVGGAGNLAMRGIAEGLYGTDSGAEVFGFWGIRSFPHVNTLFVRSNEILFPSGLRVRLLPDINLIGFRELTRFFISLCYIISWGWRNRGEKKIILTYNYSVPPIASVLIAALIVKAKTVPIVFDIGHPLTKGNSIINAFSYVHEKISEFYLRFVSGACVIVSAVQSRFFPDKPVLLVDGGVSPEIENRLFQLERGEVERQRQEVVFVLAGSLSEYNGVNLVLEAMMLNQDQRIRLKIAGGGRADVVDAIKQAENRDSRITYLGKLSLDDLFELYKEMDVFLNLRLTQKIDTKYYFPSKFLEALVVGRYTLTTKVAHIESVYGNLCGLIKGETASDCAEAMTKCLSMTRSERDNIGRRARIWMMENHTWLKQGARIYSFCDRIVNGYV